MKNTTGRPFLRALSSDQWFNEVLSAYQMPPSKTYRFRVKLAPRFIKLARDRRRIPKLLPVLMNWEHYPIEVWSAAEGALAARRESAEITAYLTKELSHPSRTRRRRAAKVLAQLTPVKATRVILHQARQSSDYVVRTHALHAALVLAMKNRRLRPEVMRLAKQAIKGRTQMERLTGYNCFEIFGDHAAGEYFRRAMDDRDPVIRANAKSWYDEWASRQKDTLQRKKQ